MNGEHTKRRMTADSMIMCSLFTVMIIIGTYIKIPVPIVPFTLQFLFTTLAGSLLGGRKGALSAFVYMLLGLLGLPVFAGGGGIGYVLQPSFGYIIGFVLGAYVTGRIVESASKLTFARAAAACFAGMFVVYFLGMAYYYVISNYIIGTPIAFAPLVLYCFLLPVPGDIVLCILAAKLTVRLRGHTPEAIRTRTMSVKQL